MPTIDECKQDPYKLDQHSGCCGFAATLMHLFVTKNDALKDFLNCILTCKAYRDVAKSTQITHRLIKRDLAGIIDIDAREDWMLCHGLMILLKESSKQKGDGDWAKCETYSSLWPWSYSNLTTDSVLQQQATKVKDLVEASAKVNQAFKKKLSYKNGDLALPAEVLKNLLALVDIKVASGTPVPNSDFHNCAGKSSTQIKGDFSKFTEEVARVQRAGSTNSVRWSGIILGVGNFPGNRLYEPYNNVTHWVYVPAKPKTAPAAGEFKIWSWGQEFDFWSGFVDGEGFYPALVVDLAK